MPRLIVPIKVKIGLRPNGHADHPAWEQLPMILALLSANPTRTQIDSAVNQFTFGNPRWFYDSTSGHADETPDSPAGQQWGMRLVSAAFAAEAVAVFPTIVTIMTQAECQAFYDDKVQGHMAEELIDVETLQGLKLYRDLLKDLKKADTAPEVVAVDTNIAKALNSLDPYPGVTKNRMRRWMDAKGQMGVEFDPSVPP